MRDKLRIGVISRVRSNTISKELAREARTRGHTYDRIVFNTVAITDAKKEFESARLLGYDILYYRTSLGLVWARELERYLSKHDRSAINLRTVKYPFLGEKIQQTLTVAAAGIRTPKTLVDATGDYQTIAKELGTTFVLKASVSAQGADVHLVHSEQELASYLSTRGTNDYFYQEYVPHDYDCRIHLVGGKAVAAYRRVPVEGDFRCNVSRGACMKELTNNDKATFYPLAEQIAGLFGLDMHVVDFLTSTEDGKYRFIEINDNAGWEVSDGLATGVDMSVLAMDYFEEVAAQQHSNSASPVRLTGTTISAASPELPSLATS
jgi:glutathione synthase/RimK-type ligase-like ATP-grasp enzyme